MLPSQEPIKGTGETTRRSISEEAQMRQATDDLSIPPFQADALFASAVQRCDEPDPDQVRQAIAAAIRAFGSIGCAERVAQEFGDHPETAVVRMRWARIVIGEAFPDWAPQPGPRPDADPRLVMLPQLGAAGTAGSREPGALSEQELWRTAKVSALI
jgi:hypothetical protein